MPKNRSLAILAALVLLPPLSGAAQAGDPSVDDILSALKPKAGTLKGTTRGIRAVTPDGPEAPSPSSAPRIRHVAIISPATSDAPSLDLTIMFRSGSADLTPAATTTISQLGKALSNPALAAYRFRIEGHTDTVGTKEANQALSQARAEKVASFLESNFGVSPTRLEPVGLGEDGLLVQTADQTAEPRNRRVHVVNLGG